MVKKKTQKRTSRLSGRVSTTFDDFKSAALLVSLMINVAVFVGWLAIKLTTEYDDQVVTLLFSR
ncbi:MAG: hypothetical protein WAV04_02200 [Candidatus Microsaccharimonas sp.]